MAKRLLKDIEPQIHGQSTSLIVLMHGYYVKPSGFVDLQKTIQAAMPDADLLMPEYPSNPFANTDPKKVAEQLAFYIQEADDKRSQRSDGGQYEKIILIGYSGGGLVVRKAFVIAMGFVDDLSLADRISPTQTKNRYAWATKVERVVLLAGLNRGILAHQPTGNLGARLFYESSRLWLAIFPRLGLSKFLAHIRCGSPFVANLRIQWIALSHTSDVLPPTIQLLGDSDDIVAEEDNIDTLASQKFYYLKVFNTGHNSIRNFREPEVGAHRRERFLKALTAPISVLETAGDTIPYANEVDPEIEHLVFVMHGIRDVGLWTQKIEHNVKEMASQLGKKVDVCTSGYGYFPLLRFLLLGARQTNVRWFMDEYTEKIARYPNAKIEFIGHSNGTYLLASALERYQACKVNHVAFAGSVVPSAYNWSALIKNRRVNKVRNDIASADWIVGVFPGFFELLHLQDIGTGGHNGFLADAVKDNTVAYFKGGHGAAIQPENHESLARFILTGEVQPPEHLLVKTQEGWVELASKLCWVIWFAIAAILVGLGFLLTFLLAAAGVPSLLTWFLYIAIVLMLLYTI